MTGLPENTDPIYDICHRPVETLEEAVVIEVQQSRNIARHRTCIMPDVTVR